MNFLRRLLNTLHMSILLGNLDTSQILCLASRSPLERPSHLSEISQSLQVKYIPQGVSSAKHNRSLKVHYSTIHGPSYSCTCLYVYADHLRLQYCSPAEFIQYVGRIHSLAVAYGGDANANLRVMEWLRHEEYDTIEWQFLIGAVDKSWIAHVRKQGVSMLNIVKEPKNGIDFKISHFAATMNGVFLHGKPRTSFNRGDLTGWAGDWITFYGDWRQERATGKAITGPGYCLERLAHSRKGSTFKIRDLVEDADGYNIGMMLRSTPDRTIVEEVENLFGPAGGYNTRFYRFFRSRFEASPRSAAQVAKEVLLHRTEDLKLNVARTLLIRSSTGGMADDPRQVAKSIPREFNEFCECFSHILQWLVEEGLSRLHDMQWYKG